MAGCIRPSFDRGGAPSVSRLYEAHGRISRHKALVPFDVDPLSTLVLRYDEQASPEKRRRTEAQFAMLLDADVLIDSQRLIEVLTADIGIVPRRTILLLRAANSRFSQRDALDERPILDSLRAKYLAEIGAMETRVGTTMYLRRVFGTKWFKELREIVNSWDPQDALSLTTHTAFNGYLTDMTCYGGDYLQKLDEAFSSIAPHGSIKQKLREIAGPSAGYVSTAFEMLILRPFAVGGHIEEYEPSLPGGGCGEALVNIGGQHVYVEARAKMDEDRPGGGFDPSSMGTKLFRKLQEKYADQYVGVHHPLLVFLSLGASVLHDIEVAATIAAVRRDTSSKPLTAVMFCDFYQPHKIWLWRNRRAKYRLKSGAVRALYALFPVKQFRATGIPL